MTMSTKIAVMKEGVIQQMDTPDRVYHFPANLFVADFIGNPKVNLLEGKVEKKGLVNLGKFSVAADTYQASGQVVMAVRPEDITISTKPGNGAVEFTAYSVLPAGADTTIIAQQGDLSLTVRVSGISHIKMDEKIWLNFDASTLNLYDKESGYLIEGEIRIPGAGIRPPPVMPARSEHRSERRKIAEIQ